MEQDIKVQSSCLSNLITDQVDKDAELTSQAS